jgi:hypothetical protein
MYQVPNEFYVRLHHCRPRFKNNREDVLLYMASEICSIGELSSDTFSEELSLAIKLFPGNSTKKIKTIHNWRTEISSLLGLVEFTPDNKCKPSVMAKILHKNQDLIEFFRFFCLKFQYPGGHLKPNSSLELLKKNVKFKPASYILKLLIAANIGTDKKFGLTKEEVTHCIFNDLRVVRDNRNIKETIELIEYNRNLGIEYNTNGDVIRYAGDILDYMELANLIDKRPNGLYYLRTIELEVINTIANDGNYFPDYDGLYKKSDLNLTDVSKTQNNWFSYVNSGLDDEIFQTDILKIIDQDIEKKADSQFIVELLNSIRKKQEQSGKIRTKDIGDVGESITIQHEQTRLSNMDRLDLKSKVIKIPEIYAAGYDINSFEGEAEIKRLIEVKTTISKNKLAIQRFHMTPNEWGAAETFKEAYYIYRLMISENNVSLFVIRDPVGLYKTDLIKMTPRHGIDISYSDKSGTYEEVLS